MPDLKLDTEVGILIFCRKTRMSSYLRSSGTREPGASGALPCVGSHRSGDRSCWQLVLLQVVLLQLLALLTFCRAQLSNTRENAETRAEQRIELLMASTRKRNKRKDDLRDSDSALVSEIL